MSEYVFCCVQVKLPTSWGDDHSKPRIIAELDDVLSDGFISWPAADDQATMWEVGGETCGLDDDRLSAALDHLVRLRVPFVAASEAKWEIDPELRVFDGNEEGRVDKFYGYDRPLIDLNDLERLGSFEAARDHLAAGNRYVGEFSIDHLPAEEPIINPVASALKRGVIRQRIEVEDVAESDEDTATFASELAGELLDEED